MTSPAPASALTVPAGGSARVRVFVDFWNFELSLKDAHRRPLRLDWSKLGPWLAQEAGSLAAPQGTAALYEGMHVYVSFGVNDEGLRKWSRTVLDRFPGVQVVTKERRAKKPPKCPACHDVISDCPHCGKEIRAMEEKGIDTAIVTDMIKLAWAQAYDIAVLVSSDKDFVPAVEFLDSKGIKVVNAHFPPAGMELARTCWGSFDLRSKTVPERT